jgi:hypothetical protein
MSKRNQKLVETKMKDGRMVWTPEREIPWMYCASERGKTIYEGPIPYKDYQQNGGKIKPKETHPEYEQYTEDGPYHTDVVIGDDGEQFITIK